MSDAHKPLTALDLADALSCFWNAAIGAAHERQEGFDTANIMVSGFSAVEQRLREIDSTTPDTRDALIKELVEALRNSSATIVAVYQWLEMVEKEGGATSIAGVAKCHAMLTSLRKNADRTEKLIMTPARAVLRKAEEAGYGAE